MLIINKNIILNGTSNFDGITAQTYQANIDSKFPENMQLSNWMGIILYIKLIVRSVQMNVLNLKMPHLNYQEQMIEENKKLSIPE